MQYDFTLITIYRKYMSHNKYMYEQYILLEKKYKCHFDGARRLKERHEEYFDSEELIQDLYRLGAISDAWKEKHNIKSSDLSFNKYGMIEYEDYDTVMKHLREVDDLKAMVWKVIDRKVNLYEDITI